jgi:hypothetical protein
VPAIPAETPLSVNINCRLLRQRQCHPFRFVLENPRQTRAGNHSDDDRNAPLQQTTNLDLQTLRNHPRFEVIATFVIETYSLPALTHVLPPNPTFSVFPSISLASPRLGSLAATSPLYLLCRASHSLHSTSYFLLSNVRATAQFFDRKLAGPGARE